MGDRRRQHDVRVDALIQLDLGAPESRAEDPCPGHLADPWQPVVALDGDVDKPPPGGPPDLTQRPADDDPAPVDDRDRLAQRLDGLHLVGREDQGLALVTKLEERLPEDRDVDGIEAGERLVHQQDLRIVEDRGDELDLLLVALRQLVGAPVGKVLDAEPVQPVARLAARPVRCHAVQRGEVRELIEHAHPRIEAALLGEVAPRRPRQGPAVGPSPGDDAGVGLEDPQDDPHRRRLARPVRAEEPEDLAARDVEREAVEGDDGAESLVKLVDREGHQRNDSPSRERA